MPKTLSTAFAWLDRLVEWFIPAQIAADKDMRKQARMFLISHLIGPFIGNTVPLALYVFDPDPGFQVAVLALSITGFWIFPFILRAFGRYNLLAMLSVQNLIFCIFWSCYFYGGVTSPTLPWILTIPLLAFFYLGASPSMRLAVMGLFAVNVAAFCAILFMTTPPESNIPLAALQGLGLISTVAASLYVTMMALFYANALASQGEMQAVMRGHLATAAELRRAAAAAEQASVAKAEFLAKMSHELRTPLNAVIGYSQMLMEDAQEEKDAASMADLEKIHGAGQHLLRLVNEVLDLSKIEAGRMELFNEEADFRTLVREVAATVEPLARRNGNTLRVTFAEDVGPIVCDVSKVKSCIHQIVENAAKFTENGTVTVHGSRHGGPRGEVLRLAVRDTGVGIAAHQLADLFEQFAVGDDASASKYGGTGLGLALSRKLCRLMGGDVEVESELGRGSCFTIALPLLARLPDAAPLQPAGGRNGAPEEAGAVPWRAMRGEDAQSAVAAHA